MEILAFKMRVTGLLNAVLHRHGCRVCVCVCARVSWCACERERESMSTCRSTQNTIQNVFTNFIIPIVVMTMKMSTNKLLK